MLILVSWLYSFIWIALPFFTKNRYALEGFLTSCSFDYISRNDSNKIVIISMFIGGFFLPLILIALFYILIVLILRKNEIYLTYQIRHTNSSRNEHSRRSSLNHENANLCAIENHNATKTANASSIYLKREIKLIKMVGIIVVMFILAWTPYAVVTLAAQLGTNIEAYINPYTTSLPALFAKTSSVYKPLIYSLNNKDFRRFLFGYFHKKIKLFKN